VSHVLSEFSTRLVNNCSGLKRAVRCLRIDREGSAVLKVAVELALREGIASPAKERSRVGQVQDSPEFGKALGPSKERPSPEAVRPVLKRVAITGRQFSFGGRASTRLPIPRVIRRASNPKPLNKECSTVRRPIAIILPAVFEKLNTSEEAVKTAANSTLLMDGFGGHPRECSVMQRKRPIWL
jgi:hypothetical protein